MTIKRVVCLMLSGVLLGGSAMAAGPTVDGSPRQKYAKRQRVREERVAERRSVHVTFSTREARVIKEYYAPRYRSLPPGLQKKLRRTGQLPPGWQKKFEPFPVVVERELVALPPGYRRGVIDGHAVVFNTRTGTIFDVVVLF